MSRGDIDQCSFGFIPTEETWDYNTDPVLRTVNEVELFEVSIVSLLHMKTQKQRLLEVNRKFSKILQQEKNDSNN